MMHVHYGNRFECLADALADGVMRPSEFPLHPEIVAVSHPGLRRWLSLVLATRKGVVANLEFPLPATLIWRLLRAVVPGIDERSAFEPGSLRWAVIASLDAVADSAPELRGYLDVADARMRHDLAGRLASQMDQYLVYRPDWVRRWLGGERALPADASRRARADEAWQSLLFRELRERLGENDWLSALERFLSSAEAGAVSTEMLPDRVHLFGATSLSPAFVDVLARFSDFLEVHLYVLNPCREYWGDVLPARAQPASASHREAGYFTTGNPLLGSWGRIGRQLIDHLQGLPAMEHEHYSEVCGSTQLARLQREILTLQEHHQSARAGDQSVQVHACHSPTREMEVLHDQLLALFDAIPDLDPSDIVVMTPRIEEYAPAIRSAFTRAGSGPGIPFALADRRSVVASSLIGAYFDLLETARGRLEVNAVLGLLGRAVVRRRFGIAEEDLPLVTIWVRESGVRWGADAGAKAALGLPADDFHTWRFGIDRMLLGVSMAGERRHSFADLHPYDGTAGADHELLGRFVEFVDALVHLGNCLSGEQPVVVWCDALQDVAARFMQPEGVEENELQVLLRALDELKGNSQRGGFQDAITLGVVLDELKALLPGLGAARAVDTSLMFSGRVTFCELVPLRSVPFRVVCLVGMNDGAYPRRGSASGFDLIAQFPRSGDRSVRDDDRYLFLEAILAAREVLYVSYVGMDQRENGSIPPSPLVDELVDYLSGDDEGVAPLTVFHALQRFSPRYFSPDSPLFSYDEGSLEASKALVSREMPAPGLGHLMPCGETEQEVALEDFISCVLRPARFFLEQSLGVRLPSEEERPLAVEPFQLEGLPRYHVREWLLDGIAERLAPGELRELLRGDGQLPSGSLGDFLARREQDITARHLAARRARMEGAEDVEVDLEVAGLRIAGVLTGFNREEAMVVDYRLGRLRSRDRLALGLRQLIATAVNGSSVAEFISDGELFRLEAGEGTAWAKCELERYVGLYRSARERALPFFTEAGWQFVKHAAKGIEQGRRAARMEWLGTRPGRTGLDPWRESQDAYHQLAFRGLDPLNEEFEQLSVSLLSGIAERASERPLKGESS